MKKNTVLFIITILLFACNKEQSADLVDIRVDVNAEECYYNLTNDIEKDIDIVSLETLDECLIAKMSKIIYKNNQFYILDKGSNSIYIFNNSGKFVSKLDKVGQGPNEYVKIGNFVVIEDCIWIVDNSLRKLICYNKDFSVIDSAPLNAWVFDMNNQDGFIYLTYNWISAVKPYQLSIYDIDNHSMNECVYTQTLEGNIAHMEMMQQLGVGPSTSLFTYPYTDVIYEIERGKVVPKYKLFFNGRFTIEPKRKGEKEGDLIRGILKVNQTANHVILTYADGSSFRYVFFDKETKVSGIYDGYIVEQLGDMKIYSPVFQPDGYLIVVHEPEYVAYKLEHNMKNMDEAYVVNRNKIESIINAGTEDDNPIIIMFKLKENSKL